LSVYGEMIIIFIPWWMCFFRV